MSFNETASRHTRTATAFFDTRAAAEKARADLVAGGIASTQINIAPEAHDTAAGAGGRWDPLEDPHMHMEDRDAYAEGLRRGGFLLSVRTDAAQYDRALEILDADGAVDMDKRESDWRLEGWTRGGDQVTSMATSSADVPVHASAARSGADGWTRGTGEVTPMATASGDVPVHDRGAAAGLGRRDMGHGRSRVRGYLSQPMEGSLGRGRGAERIAEHMEVRASGGEKVGTVDHMEGADRIKLTKTASPDGQHHYIPFAWVDHVDSHVHLNKSGAEVRSAW